MKSRVTFIVLIIISYAIRTPAQTDQILSFKTVPGKSESIPVYEVKYIARNNLDSAIRILTHIILNNENKQNDIEIYEAYLALAATYLHNNDYPKAAHAYQYALTYSVKTPTPHHNICRALNGTGYMHLLQGDYRQAAQCLFTAAQIGEKHVRKDTTIATQLISVYNNLSTALIELQEYDKALYYLSRAETIIRHTPGNPRLATIWNNMAIVYNKTGKKDASWQYGEQALELARSYEYYHAEYTILQTLATILLDHNEPAKAIPYLEASLQIKGSSNASYAARTFYLLGCAWYTTGDNNRAEYYFEQALKKAKESKSADIALHTRTQLAALYSKKRDYQNAFLQLQHAYRLRDSLMHQDKTTAVHQLEIKYRTTQKDYEIAQKQLLLKEQERLLQQKNIWLGGIAGGAVILACLLLVIHRNYRHRMHLQAQQQEINNLKASMKGEEKERARIARELHDGIAGMITAVKMNFTAVQNTHTFLRDTAQFHDAMQLLEETAHEIRHTAHNLTPEILIQHELQDAIDLFCRQVQKSSGLDISFLAYGSFDHLEGDFKLSVYRITQELINNVIKHAQATHAIVQLSRHGNIFGLTVEDDGIGMEIGNHKNGIGMQHLQSRVKSLNGRLTVEASTGSGTTVYIEFSVPATSQPETKYITK